MAQLLHGAVYVDDADAPHVGQHVLRQRPCKAVVPSQADTAQTLVKLQHQVREPLARGLPAQAHNLVA